MKRGVLKGVSRSFYLSLRLLPGAMQEPAGIAYLLARVADTIADSAGVAGEVRRGCLEEFLKQVAGQGLFCGWPGGVVEGIRDGRERHLLGVTGEVLGALRARPEGESRLIRGVLETIVSGQLLDLERFGGAGEGRVVALENDGQLEDYAWRVAGCVGEFWTELGLHTLGGKFSQAEGEELRRLGGEYGKGLQVVNILRDLPADLAMGRCYLPVADPGDEGELMAEFSRWRLRALGWLEAGFSYAGRLESRRLRAASVLPAMIGRETLLRLEGVTLEGLRGRVKVPRGRVYGMCVRAIFSEKK